MKKSVRKITAVCLCVFLAASSVCIPAFAVSSGIIEVKSTGNLMKAEKDETVYVMANADGSVEKIIVSDWIKNSSKSDKINDSSELENIENVKGEESYTLGSDNAKIWDAKGNDIYYQGDIKKQLPVDISVTYKLNGETISAEELAGKSGKVTVRFDYRNNLCETVNIGGKQTNIYVPFAMLTGVVLDNDTFSNVEVSNGKLINDGDRTTVVGLAFPGLQNNLGIEKAAFDIPDYVEITADAENFKFDTTITVATNGIFSDIDTSKLNSAEGLNASLNDMEGAMKQLIDGSSQLYDGICTLLDNSEDLIEGIDKLAAGSKELMDGSDSLDKGAADLQKGAAELSEGLNTLSSNNDALNSGATQVFETLLAAADAQIKSAGIEAPALTAENYADVLNKMIESLDETKVYDEALSQVTAAVEQQRSYIESQVSDAVRAQVAEQVIKKATGMDKESYDGAVAAGMIDSQTAQMINGAIEEQMQSEAVRSTIASNVQLEVEKAIAGNMAQEAVQQKLQAASAGAKSLIQLKASLDSYNSFYLGLQSYTAGVSQAAAGAAELKAGADALKAGTAELSGGANKLYDGILTLKDGAPALTAGVMALRSGSMELMDGLKMFNEEGVQKLADALNGDFGSFSDRLKATVNVSKEYKSFSGISPDMDGQVKFIYRTEDI